MRYWFFLVLFLLSAIQPLSAQDDYMVEIDEVKEEKLDNNNNVYDPCGIKTLKDDWEFNPKILNCAEKGDIEAQAWYGMYLWGESNSETSQGTYENRYSPEKLQNLGYYYILRAAQSGQGEAQNELGLAYMNSDYGRPLDYEKARFWLLKSHEQGDELAAFNLADIYLNGLGVQPSKIKALEYLEIAAQGGYPTALWVLGSYYTGKGDEVQQRKAVNYFISAKMASGGCRIPSEMCENFEKLFENEELLIADNYVLQNNLVGCA